jgi:hypothetical protein
MRAKVEAMLKELGAISDRGKIQAASAPGASGGPSNMDTAARLRTLVGQLSSRQMELAAKSDPPLLADKTDIIHVPDKNLTGPQTNLPFLAESIYTLYTRDRPAASVPPAAAPEPAANPPAPAPMAQAPPSAAKPAPMANLPPPLTPPPSAEPTRSLAEAPHVPGELPVSVVSDPPGAMVTFDGYNNLNCTAPCQISLGAGRHTWRATHDGYRDGLGVYNIEKGKKPVPVNITLDAKLGFVTVESKIAGLPIFLNGQKTEYQTPSRIKLREGLYKVSVEIDGNMLTQDLNMRDLRSGLPVKLDIQYFDSARLVRRKSQPGHGDRSGRARRHLALDGGLQTPAECGIKNRAGDVLIQVDAVAAGGFPEDQPFHCGIHPKAQISADVLQNGARLPFRRLHQITRDAGILLIQQRQHSVPRFDDIR